MFMYMISSNYWEGLDNYSPSEKLYSTYEEAEAAALAVIGDSDPDEYSYYIHQFE